MLYKQKKILLAIMALVLFIGNSLAIAKENISINIMGINYDLISTQAPTLTASELDYLIPSQSDAFLPPDNKRKLENLRRQAINDNNAGSQAELADLYFDGDMVGQNYVYAIAWYKQAAANNSAYANYVLSLIFQEGKLLPHNLIYAAKYKQAADAANNLIAKRKIAERSFDQNSNFYNLERAKYWFTIAAKEGDLIAQERLGDLYSDLDDELNAIKWYGKAAANNSAYAKYALGLQFLDGKQYKNQALALSWLEKAAKDKMPLAEFRLGQMYLYGSGISENNDLAYAFLEESSNNDEFIALNP